MTTVLDQYVAIIEEATYGTRPAGASRGYESEVDGWSRDVIFVEGGGRKPGRTTRQANRRRLVNRGASGRIESPILTRGEGVRLEHLLGTASAYTAVAGQTGAFTSTFTATTRGPQGSYTATVARADTGNVMRYFEYKGAVPTGISISVEEGGKLMLGVDYDALSETVLAAAPTDPEYPAGATTDMFIFEDCVLSIGGSVVDDFTAFNFGADLMMNKSRFFLGTADKKVPIRNASPAYTGTMTAEFADLVEYDRFIAGDPVAIQLLATGETNIGSSTQKPTFQLTLAGAQYGGTTPESSLDTVSMIELPYVGLSNASNVSVNIVIITEDNTF